MRAERLQEVAQRILITLLCLISLGAGCNRFDNSLEGRSHSADAVLKAYTLNVIEHSTANGMTTLNRIVTAHRSDGATLSSEAILDTITHAVKDEQRSYSFPDGLRVLIDPYVRSKSTWRLHIKPTSDKRVQLPDCGEKYRGAGHLIGRETVRRIAVAKVKLDSSGILMWLAPGIGCEVIQQVVNIFDDKGKVIGTSRKEIEYLIKGEPSAEMFSVPAEYQEVPPSELNIRIRNRLTGKRGICSPKMAAAMDQNYWAARP